MICIEEKKKRVCGLEVEVSYFLVCFSKDKIWMQMQYGGKLVEVFKYILFTHILVWNVLGKKEQKTFIPPRLNLLFQKGIKMCLLDRPRETNFV